MKRYGIIPSIKNMIETIKPMPMKEKIKHILTSYTDLVFVFGICFVLLGMLVFSFIFPGSKTVLEGAVFNVSLSNQGVANISDDVVRLLETDTSNKAVVINRYAFEYVTPPEGDNFDSVQDMQNATSMVELMKRLGMQVAAKELDFLIADHDSMKYLNGQELCGDLSQLLTGDMFAQVTDQLVYMETGEEKVSTPVAIDISGTAFAKAFISSPVTYVAFVANTERPEGCQIFLQYILNWSETPNK